ncbi:MAG: DUF2971 domain-containing protein [Spirochaetaceae bacterium]|nr:DUF2971 domain-containing protein [Spirochaetaceae bacterium]
MSIAKKMQLYKYVTMDRLKNILIDHTIRFTQPGAFNDPFELVPRLVVPEGYVRQGRVSYEFSLAAPRRPIEFDYTKADEERCHDRHSRELRESLDAHVGFLSLSKTWKSLPMWAHYAEAFAGAVIEFDGNHEFFEWTFEVQYSRDRPIRDVTLYFEEEIPISEVCDKSIEWRFEKEVRVARNLMDCKLKGMSGNFPVYVADVPPECIRGVILGERVDNLECKEIYDLIEESRITGDRAVIDHWTYALDRTPFKLSGPKQSWFTFRNYRNFPSL